ncbi:hypothetical protein NQ315_016359 [Exocentrus adspersus]|uniref:Uncharacterized protein n=1 Tax=Exocentrus adspersus TaxID=1586481 RepID=A0AAV8VQT3_9CUCU|nr:hypothetical protein NQ315_016359 [Exocentrus adspersus]
MDKMGKKFPGTLFWTSCQQLFFCNSEHSYVNLLAFGGEQANRSLNRRVLQVLQVVHEKDPWIEDAGDLPTCHHDATWPTIDEEAVQMADKKHRRRSWHAIKFERKRRKGVVEPGSPPEARQKRPSWWNIFAQAPRYVTVGDAR